VVAVIAVVVGGIGLIVVIAIVVGVVDAAQASSWRAVAAERRRNWEAHRPEYHGVDDRDADWDDD
jgi:hypothetical protein